MRIRRSKLTAEYVQIPNGTVRDSRLSYMARGVLAEVLSRPDGWEVTADELWRLAAEARGGKGEGRRAFRAAFAELKEFGYLVAEREQLQGGKHATVLTAYDRPAHSDVPHAGTSAPSAEKDKAAGHSDVPHAGTPDSATDVPHAGTSARPAETTETACHADVPPGGTSAPPAQTTLFAGHSDVPHAGTSKEENGEKKTGLKKTSSAAVASPDDLKHFGDFWLLYPKSRDRDGTLAAWSEAIASGADPQQIITAAQAYAREKAGAEWHFIKHSANWLRERRYEDDYAPEPTGKPNLRSVPGGYQPFQPPADRSVYANGF